MSPKRDEGEIFDLETEKSRRFLKLLASHPFVTMVIKANGEVQIFSKGIKADHVSQVRDILLSLEHGEDIGKD